jgi:hypothetical protein
MPGLELQVGREDMVDCLSLVALKNATKVAFHSEVSVPAILPAATCRMQKNLELGLETPRHT